MTKYEKFINNFDLNTLLYSDENIYLYDQYKDVPGVQMLFQYFNTVLKQQRHFIKLWMVYKSNQDVSDKNVLPPEYYTYLQYYYKNIKMLFGASFIADRWDKDSVKWDQEGKKWDNQITSGVMDTKKVKALMRFFMDIQQNQFTILRFVQMCQEFCASEDNVEVYVDNTSFKKNPNHIDVYYTEENNSINQLNDTLSILSDIMPYWDISLVRKFRVTNQKHICYNIDPCFLRKYTNASNMLVSDSYKSRVGNVFRYGNDVKPSFGDSVNNDDMAAGQTTRFDVNKTKGYIAIGGDRELCNLDFSLLKGSSLNQPWTLQVAYIQYSVANSWSASIWWNSKNVNVTSDTSGDYKIKGNGIRFEIPSDRINSLNFYASVNNNTITYDNTTFIPNIEFGQLRILTIISNYDYEKNPNGVIYKLYDSSKPNEFVEVITPDNDTFFNTTSLIGFNRCSGGNKCGEISIHAVRIWDDALSESDINSSIKDINNQFKGTNPY